MFFLEKQLVFHSVQSIRLVVKTISQIKEVILQNMYKLRIVRNYYMRHFLFR